jgi:hypothetical protein
MEEVEMFKLARLGLAAVALTAAVTAVAGGSAGATNIGNEGCTPGYWKNHTDNWQEYTPTSKVKHNFTIPAPLAAVVGNETFLDALQGGGGPGINGAATILLRAAVAADLNAAHEGVGYPYRRFVDPFHIQAQVNAALASLDRDTMLALANVLDDANNLGCPLN